MRQEPLLRHCHKLLEHSCRFSFAPSLYGGAGFLRSCFHAQITGYKIITLHAFASLPKSCFIECHLSTPLLCGDLQTACRVPR